MGAGATAAGQLDVKASIALLTYLLFSDMTNILLERRVCVMLFSWGPTPAAMHISIVTTAYIKQDVKRRESNLMIGVFPMNFQRCNQQAHCCQPR
jgi:hypothetical protein